MVHDVHRISGCAVPDKTDFESGKVVVDCVQTPPI